MRSAAEYCFSDINRELSQETLEATWCRSGMYFVAMALRSFSGLEADLVGVNLCGFVVGRSCVHFDLDPIIHFK